MKKTITQQMQQEYVIENFNRLTNSARNELLDFMRFLMAKTESDEEATNEILTDKKMMAGIKRGLADIKNGEVSEIEL